MRKIKVGDTVRFTGYVGEIDKDLQSDHIVDGECYDVFEIANEDTDDPCYKLTIPNPSKKKNAKALEAEVYEDECELVTSPIKDTKKAKEEPKQDAETEAVSDDDYVEASGAKVGEVYEVQMKDDTIPNFTGTCTKVLKTMIYVGDEKIKKADIDVLFYADGSDSSESEAGGEEVETVSDTEETTTVDSEEDAEPEVTDKKKATVPKKKASTRKKAATKKTVPAKQAKVETPAEPEISEDTAHEDADVLAMVEESDDLCALAKECLEDTALMEWRLGGVLHHVLQDKAYEALSDSYTGKGGFERYCINDLGVKYRKARYLINIYVDFSNAGLNGADLARVGWTKARNLIKVIDEDNAQEMLQLAEDNTVESLMDEIKIMEEQLTPDKKTETVEKGETAKKISMKFHYFEDDASFITQSLNQVMEAEGLEKEGDALYSIVTKYMTELFE